MSNPRMWLVAYGDMYTIVPPEWYEISVLDFYMLHFWLVHPNPKMRYLEGTRINQVYNRDDLAKKDFRETYSLPLTGPCPLQLVTCTVTLEQVHHFVVVFDPIHKMVFILGRFWNQPDIDDDLLRRWEIFQGPAIWRKLVWLHDWPEIEPESLTLHWQSWVLAADGDCGPTAVKVQEKLITDGIRIAPGGDAIELDLHECGHHVRQRMYHSLQETTYASYAYYCETRNSTPLHWSEPEQLGLATWDRMHNGSMNSQLDQLMATQLVEAEKSCATCSKRSRVIRPLQPRREPVAVPIPPSLQEDAMVNMYQPALARQRARLRKLMEKQPELRRFRLRGSEPTADDNEEDEGTGEVPADDPESVGPRFIPPWAATTRPRHPGANLPVGLPEQKRSQRYMKHDDTFDEYYSGPTIEQMPTREEIRSLTLNGRMIAWSCWSTFKDCGYRLLKSFHQTFYLEAPSAELVRHHFLTVGLDNWDPTSQVSDHINGEYDLRRKPGEDVAKKQIKVTDVLVVGIKDMLTMVQESVAPLANILIFLAGRQPQLNDLDGKYGSGKYLCVDLEIDAVPVPTERIEIITDIDSLIWTGPELQVKGLVGLVMGPTVGKRPPIVTHNGCYVEILGPQSEEDKNELGGRSEWLQRRTPVVTIPHTILFIVDCVGSSSRMYGYIFFPRMMHRHEYTGRWATYIPYHIQHMFWNEIVLPALAECTKILAQLSYMPPTVDYQLYRSRTTSHPKGDYFKLKKENIAPDQFLELQRIMRRKIKERPERYDLFGSFFILLEAKGFKAATRKVAVLDPWEGLTKAFPSLDYDYLRDRTKGELLLDLAVTVTPDYSVPLVGLWRKEPTVASYQSQGFRIGTPHMACQLKRYGGMQAEMEQKRARNTHVAKCISYNLEYEVTRPSNGKATEIPESDAYHVTQAYTTYCQNRIKQYQGAHTKSYGCRVEYRMGGDAVYALCSEPSELLEKVSFECAIRRLPDFSYEVTQVTQLLDSESIIWIRADTWFNFLATRVKAISDAQNHLNNLVHAANYGLITSVLTSMLFAVGNSPKAQPSYTREALTALSMDAVTHRFGMSFLQSLDMGAVSPR